MYRYWLDGPINPTKMVNFKSKVSSIEQLKDTEYSALWKLYLESYSKEEIEKYKFSDLDALNFDYNGQKYYKVIYSKLEKLNFWS